MSAIFRTAFFLLAISTLVFPLSLIAQEQESALEEQSYEVETTSVLVDVVVRDDDGNLVTDLTEDDFEIYEDGVRQEVDSFFGAFTEASRVTSQREGDLPAELVEAPPPADTGQDDADVPGDFTALVFDRLRPEARSFARDAAQHYVENYVSDESRIGVFLIDLSLRTMQLYTNDQEALLAAVERATSGATSLYESTGTTADQLASDAAQRQDSVSGAAQTAAGGGPEAAGAGSAVGSAAADVALLNMQVRMLETFEELERDQQGYATTNGLMSIVNSMQDLMGRKNIVYFSEGIEIPPAVQARFQSVIGAANRANVSIYPLDAAGLRLESTGSEAARRIEALGRRRSDQAFRSGEDTSGPMMRYLEQNEDFLRMDSHSGLMRLADSTGGQLIRDTNDLSDGLRHIHEDMESYYMLSYTPTNRDFDGEFREIEVRVKRDDVETQYRKGYYGVRTEISEPLLDFEVPVVALLEEPHGEGDFSVRAEALAFPREDDPGRVAVIVEVPPGVLSYGPSEKGDFLVSDFSIVAMIRDDEGRPVRKLSQQYKLGRAKGASGQIGDSILFYKETTLAPGRYKMEVGAYDALEEQAGFQTSELNMLPFDPTKPSLSSVMIVRSAEPLGENEQGMDTPFRFQDILLYPNLDQPLQKGEVEAVTFFFTVQMMGGSEKPNASVTILSLESALARASLPLPAPDENGRIKYASSIPVAELPPGRYQLKIRIDDEQWAQTRVCDFELVPERASSGAY